MSRHANIAIFVPHIGCAHRCSFCDQTAITGMHTLPTAADVHLAVQRAVASPNYNPEQTEIAFFGGSFTAIDAAYMLELLDAAYTHVQKGSVRGIRVSTRPDAVENEVLALLKRRGVTTIELGAQSMVDSVLIANGRGHTAAEVEQAAERIRTQGFSLGVQMMTGLYTDTDDGAKYTAQKLADCRPDAVRIYPAITLKHTRLAALYQQGKYRPQDLNAAVELCAELLSFFEGQNIPVIRLGLHSIEMADYVAGPWHPAFRELCESRLYLQAATEQLGAKGDYNVYVHPSALSKMIGQARGNIEFLKQMGYNCNVYGDASLSKYQVKCKERE
ncbi:MAG: radical SAM protein [Clostridia bacterium]|nr:radical SAM protein [Clostridia bacterium]